MEKKGQTKDVATIVTQIILEKLEQGDIPWRKLWRDAGIPRNLVSKRNYRGINLLLLSSCNYSKNDFLTLRQIKELGGRVDESEFRKYHIVVYNKIEKKIDPILEEEYTLSLLRYYRIYNVSQCIGLRLETDVDLNSSEVSQIERCERIVADMPSPPTIEFGGSKAYYDVKRDHIQMPPMQMFFSSENYYEVLWHELSHSTGSEKRLGRRELMMDSWNEQLYSIEEMTAEIASSILCSMTGIVQPELTNQAAYIQSWYRRLKYDKKLIIYAASQAQKAVDYILGNDVRALSNPIINIRNHE